MGVVIVGFGLVSGEWRGYEGLGRVILVIRDPRTLQRRHDGYMYERRVVLYNPSPRGLLMRRERTMISVGLSREV